MKKILVSGCANCPYLKVYNNGDGKISSGECTHPSFYVKADLPIVGMMPREFLGFNENGSLVPNNMPIWCPLPDEIQIYNPNTRC